jgi:replication factor C subunit 2/4
MLYHPDIWRDRVLEMNASDERGIKVVREKVKAFAQRSVGAIKHEGYPSPPFKIIILDEADTMTKDAQGALRRTIETFSNVTRFCLVCNYVSRIIEPLASRCAKMRFVSLDTKSMQGRLNMIAKAENVTYKMEVYDKILDCSKGDMRRAVTLLQSCVNFYGADGQITPNALEEISGEVPVKLMDALWEAVEKKDFDSLTNAIDNIMLQGFPALACLTKVHDDVLDNERITDAHKAIICEAIAAANKNLADGADGHLQLQAVSTKLLC